MTDTLSQRCSSFSEAATEALQWIHAPSNAEIVPEARRPVLDRAIKRIRRRAGKLRAAAESNMAVSVFGPSQNGKSFLISVLARPQGGALVADYAGPDGQLDYISKINPEGQGESTGLVTRFTMSRPVTPDGFPIPLTLLGEADILQTIANTYFKDGDESEPPLSPEALQSHVAQYAAQLGPAHPGLTEDSVWELADYIDRNFGATAYGHALQHFWSDAARIAPKLNRAARAGFFSVLWGGHEAFGALYTRLGSALDKLGHPDAIFAGLDALLPRESSIIDVAALRSLGDPDAASLQVSTLQGQVLTLSRGEACALAAELVLPMRDQPDPVFASTDLLDFPGARNRFEYSFEKEFRNAPARIPELFLRGKVAFLFDRYVENQAINAMLLCIKDSNMEATDLPGLVENWIDMTQGPTPEQRARTACILFFVLTFFDVHLIDSAAAADETTRFQKRIFMSLLEKFRKSEGWVDNWTTQTPFNNLFWIRNPNFWVEALFDYTKHPDGTVTEALKPEKQPRIADLKAGCLAAENVQRHFAEPEAAWDAAMTENDGGVSYLVGQLKQVCKPDAKANQIAGQMDVIETELLTALREFYVSDDLAERREQAEAAADTVIDGLEITLENRSFSSLLSALMVDADEVMDRMAQLPSTVRIAAQTTEPVVAREPSQPPIRPGRPTRPGRPRPAETAPPAASPSDNPASEIRTLSREAFQAEAAMNTWAQKLEQLKSDTDFIRTLGMTPEAIATLVGELQHGARLAQLQKKISDALALQQFGLTLAGQARPASLKATEIINRFVSHLGFVDTPITQRPVVSTPTGDQPVFVPKRQRDDASDLPDAPRPALVEFWTDWVHALYALFSANAMEGQDDRSEDNLRLGQILTAIETAAKQGAGS